MGEIHPHPPVLSLLVAFSRYPAGLDWARRTAEDSWGPVALASPTFEFCETRFYEATMGSGLKKVIWGFEQLIDPARLVDRKLQANAWERQYRDEAGTSESRPLNLDPGYLTLAKLVLASTKDRDHRLHLQHGVFAENTLFFREGAWCARPWTYPDYRRSDYHQFLMLCRDYLRERYRRSASS